MNMVNVNLSEDYDEGDKHGTWTWDKEKNSESQTGVEPMASKIPIGRSNH